MIYSVISNKLSFRPAAVSSPSKRGRPVRQRAEKRHSGDDTASATCLSTSFGDLAHKTSGDDYSSVIALETAPAAAPHSLSPAAAPHSLSSNLRRPGNSLDLDLEVYSDIRDQDEEEEEAKKGNSFADASLSYWPQVKRKLSPPKSDLAMEEASYHPCGDGVPARQHSSSEIAGDSTDIGARDTGNWLQRLFHNLRPTRRDDRQHRQLERESSVDNERTQALALVRFVTARQKDRRRQHRVDQHRRQLDAESCSEGDEEDEAGHNPSSEDDALSLLRDELKNIEVFEEIGRGGFGRVYKASWRGTPVAIKQILLSDSLVSSLTMPTFTSSEEKAAKRDHNGRTRSRLVQDPSTAAVVRRLEKALKHEAQVHP